MEQQSRVRRHQSHRAGLIGGVALAAILGAPVWAQPTPSAASNEVDEVVVTGTSIRGEQPVGSDLISLDREEIQSLGAQTTADVLRKVPQLNNFNGAVRPTLGGSVGLGTSPGLRNLSPNATLVLVNGQRLIGEGANGAQVDPTSIPPSAIERVEIVADGASAIYGSDAVAGVINIILRRDLDGVEVSLRQGWGQHGYDASDINFALGKVWSTGSASVVLGYNENSHLANYDLPYYTDDLRPFGGIDLRPTGCYPPNVTLSAVTYAPPTYAPGTAACTPNLLNDTLPDFRRTGVVATARQEITDKLAVFADLKHTSAYSDSLSTAGSAQVTIPATNPFFLRPAGAVGASETVVLDVTGITGVQHIRAQSKSTTVVIGADYKLPRDFNLQASLNYGQSANEAHGPSFDPVLLAQAAAGTTTATALDPFGGRTNPAVAAAIANFENLFASDQELYDYQAKIDGPLFALPGGDLKIAVGAGYREYKWDALNTVGAIGAGQNPGMISATRKTKSGYGEVLAPLVGPENAIPFVRALELSGAVRYDDYSDFGDTTNPKVGATWSPFEGLTIRGSYGKSFHAPDMGDSYAVDTRAIYFPIFPLVPPGSPFLPTIVLAGGNPGLKPEKATTYSVGAEFEPAQLEGFRASLSYWNIEYTDQVNLPPISSELFTNPAFAGVVLSNPTQADIDEIAANFRVVQTTLPIPPGVRQVIDLRRRNLGATKTDGVDFSASYRWENGWGSFVAGFAGTHVFDFRLKSTPVAPYVPQRTFSRTTLRTEIAWVNGPVSAGAAWNHSGRYDNTYAIPAGGTTVRKVRSFDTVDLRAAYELSGWRWAEGTTLSINIDNALDEDPPRVLGIGGFATTASPLGRMVWVGLKKAW